MSSDTVASEEFAALLAELEQARGQRDEALRLADQRDRLLEAAHRHIDEFRLRAERAEAEVAKLRTPDDERGISPVEGAPHPDACTFREPDSCSGVYRCFLDGGGGRGVIGKGDTEAEAYADFAARYPKKKAGEK